MAQPDEDLIPVSQIFGCDVDGVFYKKSEKQFYARRKNPIIRNLRPLSWTEVKRVYKCKNGEPKTFVHRYVSLPYRDGFIKLSEKELQKYLTRL
jgi:hypothetical protein